MNSEIQTIFKDIESAIIRAVECDVPKEQGIYVCGFWLFYCDHQKISAPCFAYNNVPTDVEVKWSPAEWVVDIHDGVYDKLNPLYERLSDLMSGKSDEEWENLIHYQYEFYCLLCNSLNRNLSPFKKWNTTSDFLIGIFEEREDEEIYENLVRSSIGEVRVNEIGIL